MNQNDLPLNTDEGVYNSSQRDLPLNKDDGVHNFSKKCFPLAITWWQLLVKKSILKDVGIDNRKVY